MKISLFYFCIFCMSVAPRVNAEESPSKDLDQTRNVQLTLSVEKDAKELNPTKTTPHPLSSSPPNQDKTKPFRLRMHFENISTNEIYFVEHRNRSENSPVSFVVIAPSGKEISPIYKPKRDSAGGGGWDRLAPGQIIEFNYNLNAVYKLNKVGTYKIVAKYEINLLEEKRGDVRGVVVVSKPFFLKVVPNNQ